MQTKIVVDDIIHFNLIIAYTRCSLTAVHRSAKLSGVLFIADTAVCGTACLLGLSELSLFSDCVTFVHLLLKILHTTQLRLHKI